MEVFFSRGFSVPKADFPNLTNPLIAKGGWSWRGEGAADSFFVRVENDSKSTNKAIQEARRKAEYDAKLGVVNNEGHIPVAVTFRLTEETFPLLAGQLEIPGERTGSVPIKTFDQLRQHDGGQLRLKAEHLTPEELKRLKVEVGTTDIGSEGGADLLETMNRKNFEYAEFLLPTEVSEGEDLRK